MPPRVAPRFARGKLRARRPPPGASSIASTRASRGICSFATATRTGAFPRGTSRAAEQPEAAAVREVGEETGLKDLAIRRFVDTIEWNFRFRGDLIHKVCHFFLMEAGRSRTSPQRTEGITACRWSTFKEAERMVAYRNAREVLRRAHDMILESVTSAT